MSEPVIAGKWRVTGILSSGSVAHVLAAEEIATGRRVAIKMARRHPDGEAATALLRREALALGGVHSPHLPELLASGDDGDDPYFVMARLDGEALNLDGRPRPLDEVRAIVADVAEALDVLHAAGWVHCDVKPANLFRCDGRMVLIDLNSALPTGGTTGGQFAGSAPYMAPELWRGEPVSPATDVYALAALGMALATGAPLYAAATTIQWMNAHLEAAPPTLAAHGVVASPSLEATFARALAKDPAARPQRARDFSRGLAP